MAAASDVTRLLDDIEARQQQVIEELDALIVRIESVIAEWTEPAKKTPTEQVTAVAAGSPAIAGEIAPAASEPAPATEPTAAPETAPAETKAA